MIIGKWLKFNSHILIDANMTNLLGRQEKKIKLSLRSETLADKKIARSYYCCYVHRPD